MDDICFGDPLFVLALTYVRLEIEGQDTIYPDLWAKALELDIKAELHLEFYRLFYRIVFMRKHATTTTNNKKVIFDIQRLKDIYQQWKLTTHKGDYVLKQFNPTIIKKPNAVARYRISGKIAKKYSKYINAVYAMTVNNDTLFAVNNHTFMLFPYIDATPLNQNEIEMKHVIKMSNALAIMHSA